MDILETILQLLLEFVGISMRSHITVVLDGLQECYQFACSVTGSYRLLEDIAKANHLLDH